MGTTPSTTIAFAPAILFAPVGNVVEAITFPTRSLTEPTLIAFAVKSPETSPAWTVYVPVKVVPSAAAVKVTVRSVVPVSSVTVKVEPA